MSSRGIFPIIILFNYDSNEILEETTKNRGVVEMVIAFTKVAETIIKSFFKPKLNMLQKEAYPSFNKKIKHMISLNSWYPQA